MIMIDHPSLSVGDQSQEPNTKLGILWATFGSEYLLEGSINTPEVCVTVLASAQLVQQH